MEFQQAALETPLGIPILYGVDAVHGHNNLKGAVIFPHNIGLGAANDPDLMRRIGAATAEEMVATGALWNFGPVLAVAQDIRWGRIYESYSENSALVSSLASAYITGLQGEALTDPLSVAATAKHYVGDGGARWGTSQTYLIDQGDMQVDETVLRGIHLPPYQAAIDAGAMTVMASFSSWNGVKMHAQKYLLTDVLKGELGFQGFVVSDWAGIDQVNKAVMQMDEMTQQNAALVEQAAAASRAMEEQAGILGRMMGFFRITGASAEHAALGVPARQRSAPAAPNADDARMIAAAAQRVRRKGAASAMH